MQSRKRRVDLSDVQLIRRTLATKQLTEDYRDVQAYNRSFNTERLGVANRRQTGPVYRF